MNVKLPPWNPLPLTTFGGVSSSGSMVFGNSFSGSIGLRHFGNFNPINISMAKLTVPEHYEYLPLEVTNCLTDVVKKLTSNPVPLRELGFTPLYPQARITPKKEREILGKWFQKVQLYGVSPGKAFVYYLLLFGADIELTPRYTREQGYELVIRALQGQLNVVSWSGHSSSEDEKFTTPDAQMVLIREIDAIYFGYSEE